MLNRKHAELVLADQAVEKLFQRNCYTTLERANGKMWERVCYSGGLPALHFFMCTPVALLPIELHWRTGASFQSDDSSGYELQALPMSQPQLLDGIALAPYCPNYHLLPRPTPPCLQMNTTFPRCWPFMVWIMRLTARAKSWTSIGAVWKAQVLTHGSTGQVRAAVACCMPCVETAIAARMVGACLTSDRKAHRLGRHVDLGASSPLQADHCFVPFASTACS